MGKALAAISEKTNATKEQSLNPQQQFHPQPRFLNTGQYLMIQQNIRQYQQNQRQFMNTNQSHYQPFDQRQQY